MKINDYRVLSVIAQTGLSTLYLVEHEKMQTRWALKKIPRTSGISYALFAEADLLKNLSHPSLPRIMDVFEEKEAFYLVEEYLEGRDLRAFLKQGQPIKEVVLLEWYKTLCSALIYLHGQNPPIIHRDIKPANIMVLTDGTLRLIDFGISKEYKKEEKKDAYMAGTAGYAAPEQFSKGLTDVRTDIYSLGVTMYQMLTGQKPEEKDGIFPPASKYVSSVSAGMEQILARCLQQVPADRYQTVEDLLDDLVHIDRFDEPRRIQEAKQRRRKQTVITLALLGIALAAGGGALRFQSMKNKQEAERRQEELRIENLYQEGLADISSGKGDLARDVFEELLTVDAASSNYLAGMGDALCLLAQSAQSYQEQTALLAEAERYYQQISADDTTLKASRMRELNNLRQNLEKEHNKMLLVGHMEDALAARDYERFCSLINEGDAAFLDLMDSTLNEPVIFETDAGPSLQVMNSRFFYYGDMENGIRKGQGVWFNYTNHISYAYDGAWDNDMPNGEGIYRILIDQEMFTDADYRDIPYEQSFEGTFKDGVIDGKAVVIWYLPNGYVRRFYNVIYVEGVAQPMDQSSIPMGTLDNDPSHIEEMQRIADMGYYEIDWCIEEGSGGIVTLISDDQVHYVHGFEMEAE